MARILVIEDERALRDVVAYNLRRAGYEVLEASTAAEGLALVRGSRPDLVLLDLMLPDLSGTEVCKAVRADSSLAHVRIIMLTARSEEVDRIVGFELGADDYVTKPFSVRELVLRVGAVLRRGAEPSVSPELRLGPLVLDAERHRVTVDGKEVALTALEFRLLHTLLQRQGRVQTRERLLEDVWGMRGDITTRTVDTHVKRLREKLGEAGKLIETVRGVGYRIVESVEAA